MHWCEHETRLLLLLLAAPAGLWWALKAWVLHWAPSRRRKTAG